MSDNSYKDIVKTNTAFGGIRIFQMLVNILKTKIFALFLGPDGMGVQSLLSNAINTLHQFTTFGVFRSAVRDISQANATNSKEYTHKVISVFKTLVLVFGIFGMLICIIFAPVLSKSIMGSQDYTWAFVIISLALLFESLTNGIISIFQGLRKVKKLALSSFIGAVISLTAITPLIVIWREKSIPYAIVISYFCLLVVYCFSYRKNVEKNIFSINKSKTDIKEIGVPITKNGTLLMMSFCVHSLLTLLTTSLIARFSGVETVGFYTAANTATYGNLIIFTSILTSDYYPRMSALQNDKDEMGNVFNKQIEIFVLLLTIVASIFLVFTKYVVLILYSKEFYPIIAYSQIMAISLILKIVWQTCATTLMAAGKNKEYLVYDAIVGNGLFFILNMTAFYFGGLLWMSYSFVFSSLIIMFIMLGIVKKLAGVQINKRNLFFILLAIFSLLLQYSSLTFLQGNLRIIFTTIISLLICISAIIMLNRRVGIVSIIHKITKK